jgi:tetratricopeptide (TPR) repeat protein
MKFSIHITILLLIISAAQHSLFSDETYSTNKRGNYLYKNQQYKEALKVYDDALLLSPSDNRLKMNKGSAHYQLGEFDKAEESYNAALSSDNKDQLADAHYNMGNILFRQGAQMYQQGPQQAIEKFKSAYEHYVKSLEFRPTDTDAKWNLQLAHQVMKQLEQQKQQQQNNKDNKDDKNKQDQQNQDQNKNDQKKDEQKDKQQQQQDKKEDQEKKDQDKDQQQKQDENQQDQKQQQQPQQSEMKKQEDLKKEEAKRIIEMFADDADTLNKPMTKKKAAGMRQPTQDW